MLSHGKFLGTAVGALVTLVTEATRRGVKWITDKTRITKTAASAPRPGQNPPQPDHRPNSERQTRAKPT